MRPPAPPDGGPPSCVPGADALCLPAGLSQLGRDGDEAHFEEAPARAARLGAFALDRREVTAGEYQACVRAGRCEAPSCEVDERAPVRCVRARDAEAYCALRGGRLPTEAEWERAAAGALPEHRRFPWGESSEGEDVTPEGLLALGGGVAEWVADLGDFYQLPPGALLTAGDAGADATLAEPPETVNALGETSLDAGANGDAADVLVVERTESGLVIVDDPRGPTRSPWRVVRGGDETLPRARWTSTLRRFRRPDERLRWVGLRCAYPAPR